MSKPLITFEQQQTLQKLLDRWGYIVIGSYTPRKIGDQVLDFISFDLEFPWRIIAETTLEEHLEQRRFLGKKDRGISKSKHYFYRCIIE